MDTAGFAGSVADLCAADVDIATFVVASGCLCAGAEATFCGSTGRIVFDAEPEYGIYASSFGLCVNISDGAGDVFIIGGLFVTPCTTGTAAIYRFCKPPRSVSRLCQ